MSQESSHARSANGYWSIVHKLGCPPIHQSTEEETTSNRKSPGQVCGEIRRGVTQSQSAYTRSCQRSPPYIVLYFRAKLARRKARRKVRRKVRINRAHLDRGIARPGKNQICLGTSASYKLITHVLARPPKHPR